MSRREGREQDRDMAALGGRIKHWHRTRQKRSPMPEELWQEATRLAEKHGVSAISRQLGVGYATLRKRVAAAEDELRQGHGGEGRFVELSATELLGGGVPTGAVVEVSTDDGKRMTVRLDQGERLDVVGLVVSFLGGRP